MTQSGTALSGTTSSGASTTGEEAGPVVSARKKALRDVALVMEGHLKYHKIDSCDRHSHDDVRASICKAAKYYPTQLDNFQPASVG